GGVHVRRERGLANGAGGSGGPGGPGALRSGCAWDHAGECEQRQGQTSVRGRATHGELRRRTQQSSGVSPALVGYAVPEPVKEIGRASCREREWVWEAGVEL